MKKFIERLFLFSIPIFIILIIPSYILWETGENFIKIDKVLESDEKHLIGYAYNEDNYVDLKYKGLTGKDQYDVVALGSSRVLQFRREMFESSFYNAGFAVSAISEFLPFLRKIPESRHPKYLIIGLDQWMFNKNWIDDQSISEEDVWSPNFQRIPGLNILKNVWEDLLGGKYGLSFPECRDSIRLVGLNAVINHTGFRNDGSMLYGDQISKLSAENPLAHDFGYSETFARIENEGNRFQYGYRVDENAILELNQLLEYCKENQIEVIAFLPPYANAVYEEMIQSGNYVYLPRIYGKIVPLFNKYDYELYDFSNVVDVGSSDKETIDGFHGGERTYQKILLEMLESGSILNETTDYSTLKEDLERGESNYLIYDY